MGLVCTHWLSVSSESSEGAGDDMSPLIHKQRLLRIKLWGWDDSPLRHYVWGALIVAFGVFTVFGMWFLLGG